MRVVSQRRIPIVRIPIRLQSWLLSNCSVFIPSIFICAIFAFVSTQVNAGDLSRYRKFELGSNVQAVAEQIKKSPEDAATLHSRPALLQELRWSPQPLGPSDREEAVKSVVFSFLDDRLYRVEVSYDRYETEGLTSRDLISAISEEFGLASSQEPKPAKSDDSFGDPGTVVAEWRDDTHVFQLLRFDFGPTYKLIGTNPHMEQLASNARVRAERLHAEEAPQREAAERAKQAEAERAEEAAARAVNKPKFRP